MDAVVQMMKTGNVRTNFRNKEHDIVPKKIPTTGYLPSHEIILPDNQYNCSHSGSKSSSSRSTSNTTDDRWDRIGLSTSSSSLSSWISLPSADSMVEYFFDQMAMGNTWLSGLPYLYARSCDTSAIRHALRAASLLLLGNQTGDHKATYAARRSYGHCLKLLNYALNDPDQKLQDETLCTILVIHLIGASILCIGNLSVQADHNGRILQENALRIPDHISRPVKRFFCNVILNHPPSSTAANWQIP